MTARLPDFIGVLEAAYDVGADDEAWVTGVVAAAAHLFPRGHGAYALTYDSSTDTVARWRSHGISPAVVAGILGPLGGRNPDGSRATQFFPAPVWRRLMAPFPRALTMGQLFPARTRDPFMAAFVAAAGDQLGVRGTDANGSGITLSCPWWRASMPAKSSTLFAHLGTHLAAAYRLRRALPRRSPISAAEAIFDAAGRLVHLATGEDWEREAHDVATGSGAGKRSTRDGLARILAVSGRRVNEALGPLRRTSPAQALALWRGLFEGRWSLVSHRDRDGKRFLLAFRNPPGVRGQLALNQRERHVVQLICQGCSQKEVGYELGLAVSTVSEHLRNALRKLRLRDRPELMKLGLVTGVTARDPNK